MHSRLLFLVLVSGLVLAKADGQTTYLHAGRLFDGTSTSVKTEQTLIIEGGRVQSVQAGYQSAPAGASVIDLKDYTVLPGLMDMHVHLEHESNPKAYEERFRKNPADVAYDAAVYAERTLLAGFTTVRDLGGSGVNVSLRNAINAGKVLGPTIYTAEKSLATTGGHADPTNGVRDDLRGDPGPKEGVINSPEEAHKAVRQRYKNGADVIKITATGGVLSVAKDGQGPQFTDEELAGVIAAAKDYGMTTAAHAHGKEGMLRAVRAGITSIEHGTLADAEVFAEMKRQGTYLVPTISAGRFVAEKAKTSGYFPAVIVPKAISIGAQIQETAGEAYRAGVKLAFGTDAGVGPHGDNAREFVYMHEAGIPLAEALVMATRVPAEMLGLTEEVGTLRPGLRADVVAVRGNLLGATASPDDDQPALLLDVPFVMKAGAVVKLDGARVY